VDCGGTRGYGGRKETLTWAKANRVERGGGLHPTLKGDVYLVALKAVRLQVC